MPEEERVEASELAVTAIEKFPADFESASRMLKEGMDRKFGGNYHVIIGSGFGFTATHEIGHKLYLFFGTAGVLCFK
jgi:dynein light chain 4